MPDDSYEQDAEIIRAAYAEKVKEAFKAFAENIGMGQNQKNSIERFVRSLQLVRQARDLAIEAAVGHLGANQRRPAAAEAGAEMPAPAADALSPEDQALIDQVLIDQVLAGTTGAAPRRRRR